MNRISKLLALIMLVGLVSTPVLADSLTAVDNSAVRGKVRQLDGTGMRSAATLDAVHQMLLDDTAYVVAGGFADDALTDTYLWVGSTANIPVGVDVSGVVTLANDGTVTYVRTATIGANPVLVANQFVWGTTGLIAEGATVDDIETLIAVTDPTSADKTITFPDATGTIRPTGVGTIAEDDATPTITPGVATYSVTNADAQNITSFVGGVEGQMIYIMTVDANTTFVDSAVLECGGNVNPGATDVTSFVRVGSVWYMVETHDNSA
jgi:uncharacterized protein YdeI (BOF family)